MILYTNDVSLCVVGYEKLQLAFTHFFVVFEYNILHSNIKNTNLRRDDYVLLYWYQRHSSKRFN